MIYPQAHLMMPYSTIHSNDNRRECQQTTQQESSKIKDVPVEAVAAVGAISSFITLIVIIAGVIYAFRGEK